jgi:hypothetical protein
VNKIVLFPSWRRQSLLDRLFAVYWHSEPERRPQAITAVLNAYVESLRRLGLDEQQIQTDMADFELRLRASFRRSRRTS